MKKYAIVGAGSRGYLMYAKPIYQKFSDVAKLVGVYDTNYKRAELLSKNLDNTVPIYKSYEEMLEKSKPDAVIVAPPDCYHHEYIIKALEAGCDAICEKPMTIDAKKANAILEAEKRTKKKVIVTFNVRCGAFVTKIKELVQSGVIGDVLSVHFEWLLDTVHGADYFRRWHRRLENSGGLLVHKSTHHFDMVNWIIGQDPVAISAFGTKRFYGPTTKQKGQRCLTCEYKEECPYYINIESSYYKEMYFDCEDADGYYRDRCIFDEEIDIYDSMSVNVKYSGDAIMSYSLTAHSPYEGYKLCINGTEGRIEAETLTGGTQDTFAGATNNSLKVYNRKGEEIIINIPIQKGSHGGADDVLQKLLFKADTDTHGYIAGSRAGVMSLIIGAAANKSIEQGKTMMVGDLIKEEYL